MPPGRLVDSCARHTQYPFNLNELGLTRPYLLKTLQATLREQSHRLFCQDGAAKLSILRYDRSKAAIVGEQLATLRQLKESMPCDSPNPDLLTCQYTFVNAHSSRDVLNISKPMMLWLLSIFQALPNFLEFIFPFGEQLYDFDFHFSALRQDSRLGPNSTRGSYPELQRSGQDFQLCYNLKGIERKPGDKWQWSARQAAVFSSFDIQTGQANWIIIKSNDILKTRFEENVQAALQANPQMYEDASACFVNALNGHLTVVDWCAENWRWYIEFFEEQLENNTARALVFKPVGGLKRADYAPLQPPTLPQPLFSRGRTWTGRILRGKTYSATSQQPVPLQSVTTLPTSVTIEYEDPDQLPPEFEMKSRSPNAEKTESEIRIDELQNAQYLESKAGETVLILKSNLSVLSVLHQKFEDVRTEIADLTQLDQTFRNKIQTSILGFLRYVEQVNADLNGHLARMETISKLVTDRKTLLYSLVDYQNMQANEAFARKAQESAEKMMVLTEDMQKLTRKTAVETVLMRIITVVTLLFLPATFVSTMMSANIINFGPAEASITGTTNSPGAVKFFLTLTLTLMLGTLVAGVSFYLREVNHEAGERGVTGA